MLLIKPLLRVLVVSVVVAAHAGAAIAQPPAGRGAPPPAVRIGPSAPVPPEVAMLRPGPAELQRINDALRAFIAADRSPASDLLKKYEPIIMVPPPRLNVAATYTQTAQRMGPRHEGFVETAKAGNIDLLLHGDSITDWWVQNDDNKKMFEKYFADIRTANFAIAGDTTQGVLWGMHNGEGQGFQPKAVMLMIGTNNTIANTAPEIAEGIGAIVLEMRKDFPDAKILLLGIFPRSTPDNPLRSTIAEINKSIAKLHDGKHVFYLDIGGKFLDAEGNIPRDVMGDGLHPTTKGYEIWAEAVKEPLANLLK